MSAQRRERAVPCRGCGPRVITWNVTGLCESCTRLAALVPKQVRFPCVDGRQDWEPETRLYKKSGEQHAYHHADGRVTWHQVVDRRDVPPAEREPRVWHAGDPEPTDVAVVRDFEDDVWVKRDGGDWSTRVPSVPLCQTWGEVLDSFGPLTEVREFLAAADPGWRSQQLNYRLRSQ